MTSLRDRVNGNEVLKFQDGGRREEKRKIELLLEECEKLHNITKKQKERLDLLEESNKKLIDDLRKINNLVVKNRNNLQSNNPSLGGILPPGVEPLTTRLRMQRRSSLIPRSKYSRETRYGF